MDPDLKAVEQLVEIIPREVLIAMAEKKEQANMPAGARCEYSCADDVCV